MKNLFFLIPLMMIAFGFSLSGCRNAPTTQQYQSKYRETELIGEWVYKEAHYLPKDQYEIDSTELLTEDTLEFGYNNKVISRKRKTLHHSLIYPEEEWGSYEIAKGVYKLQNDTLIISFDYTNITRTTFGKDPTSFLPIVYVDSSNNIDCYYALKDLNSQEFTMNQFLRKWDGGESKTESLLHYKRR